MSNKTKWCLDIVLIIGLSIACYFNSLQNELCFDDMFAILYNGDTSANNQESYFSIWKHDFWGNDISLNQSHKSYRPITVTYFRTIREYTLFLYNQNPDRFVINNATIREQGIYPEYIHREKDLQPFYFHIGNIFIHTINSILILILIKLLFDHYDNKNQYKHLGLISGLLFCSHPIHVEAVTGIVGAAELLSCLFGLLSFFCYVFIHRVNSIISFIFYVIITSIFYYLSALSKEGGVTISALMILYSMFKFSQNNRYRFIFLWILPILLLMFYLFLRSHLAGIVMSVGNEVFRRTENPVAFASSFKTRLLTIPYLHYYYLSLLIYPNPLSADYSFNCIPLIQSLNDKRNILSIITYLIIFLCLIYSFAKILIMMKYKENKNMYKYWDILIIFGWIIVPFIPSSNIFFFVATFIAERLLYLPSIGFCILVSYLLINFIKNKLFLWSIIGTIISLYGYKTYNRNFDWENEETLFESAYKVCPNSVKVLQNSV